MHGDQPALLDVKLLLLDDFPFMKPSLTQRITPVFLREFLFPESKNITHNNNQLKKQESGFLPDNGTRQRSRNSHLNQRTSKPGERERKWNRHIGV